VAALRERGYPLEDIDPNLSESVLARHYSAWFWTSSRTAAKIRDGSGR